jgi:hypothetical protein
MKFKTLSLLILPGFLALILCSGPLWAESSGYRLPPGLKIGQISGPGDQQLTKALKKRARGGSNQAVLSGRVSFSRDVSGEREVVPEEKPSGQPYLTYEPDPFTSRLWRTEVTPQAVDLTPYNLERYVGVMTFDWQLAEAKSGAPLDSGRVTVDIDRTRGGYLAEQGVVPKLSGGGRDNVRFEDQLADELVRLLTLDLGRFLTASDLEAASDKWSRQARSAASAGNWDLAKSHWLELLEMNPEYGPALYNLGVYYERQKNPEEAWRYYRQAFVSDGSVLHRQALTRLTEALSRTGRLPRRGYSQAD